jgi:hypothetical protein
VVDHACYLHRAGLGILESELLAEAQYGGAVLAESRQQADTELGIVFAS